MQKQTSQRVRLGLFVLAGTTALVLGLYFVGQQRSIFHASVKVHSDFKTIDGLMPGNNVRFNGYDVGAVTSLEPAADSVIRVTYTIDEDYVQWISVNAIASIGTDGLLGNKILNLEPARPFDRAVQEGDALQVRNLMAMDAAMRTLNETNDNLLLISRDLKGISERLTRNNSFWQLLGDTALSERVRSAIVKVNVVSENSAVITGDLRGLIHDVKNGKGNLGALVTDTSVFDGVRQTVVRLEMMSDTLAMASGNFNRLAVNATSGSGTVAALINDTTLIHDLNRTVISIQGAADGFNNNMALLRQSRLLKRYFKRASKTED
jgi:phospholipid/cholesterol/gamma-HCH transport system substrate-binding protein